MSQPEIAEGWKDIAKVLGVEVRAAQDRAKRAVDPLPVRMGHKGPWAYVSALRDWIYRQDMAYQVHIQLRETIKARGTT